MITNYYKSHSYTLTEVAICLEDSDDGKAKFFIPSMTPTASGDEPYDKEDPVVDTSNILSGTKGLDIKECITSNYITIRLPEFVQSCKKGDKFVLSFIGGDINKPYLLGRYYNE